jgi:sulfur-carrier protein
MSVVVVLPSQLRELVGGRGRVELQVVTGGGSATTVAATLDALRAAHPAVYERIVTERRELRPHVNVFVGRDDIRWSGGFDAVVPEGAEVVVLPSVSGG